MKTSIRRFPTILAGLALALGGALAPAAARPAPAEAMRKVATPTQTTCEDITALLGMPLARSVSV